MSGAASNPPIRIWCAFYRQITAQPLLRDYRSLLTDAERAQEQRFYFADDRHRYLVTRALVRTVLAEETGSAIAPEQWRFVADEHGRPRIANEDPGANVLSFNISHTKGLVILGVTKSRALGVDVENARDREPNLEIADRYFTGYEVEALSALPAPERSRRFFEYWTLKESYMKARGLGLAVPLHDFGFRWSSGSPLQLHIEARQQDRPERWMLWQVEIRDDYIAAVCAERGPHPDSDPVLLDVVPLRSRTQLACRPLRASPQAANPTLCASGNEVEVRKSGASPQAAKTTFFAAGNEVDVRKSGAADFCQIKKDS